MPSTDRVVIDFPTATVWSDPAIAESLRRGIARDPDRLIGAAATRPLKISHETLIVEQQWPVGDRPMWVVVKQYRPQSFWKALAAVVRPAKSTENWSKAEFLLSRGIATPRPLLACRPRGWLNTTTSFLTTPCVVGGENLHLFGWRIATRPLDERLRAAARCADALGRLLGRMHQAGAAHRDLKAANLLVVEEGDGVTVYLVDLDGLQPHQRIGFRRQARDLARLAAGLAAHCWVPRSICRRFLRAYLSEMATGGIHWKSLWRAISAESERRIRRKQKRGDTVL